MNYLYELYTRSKSIIGEEKALLVTVQYLINVLSLDIKKLGQFPTDEQVANCINSANDKWLELCALDPTLNEEGFFDVLDDAATKQLLNIKDRNIQSSVVGHVLQDSESNME